MTYVKTDAPFYLRGYLAIEEEIKQVTTRKDKNAFSKGLIKYSHFNCYSKTKEKAWVTFVGHAF